MKIFTIGIVSLLLVLTNTMAYSQVYRWVDSKGKVHFSDKPQSGQPTPIKIPPNLPSRGDSTYQEQLQKQQQLLNAYSARRLDKQKQENDKDRKKQLRQDKISTQCAKYEDYLKIGGGIYKVDINGERVFMKESEIARYRAKKQAEYDKYCR